MQLTIRGSHLRCKVWKKCQNVPEWMEIVDRNKDVLLLSPAALWIVSGRDKNSDEKIKKENDKFFHCNDIAQTISKICVISIRNIFDIKRNCSALNREKFSIYLDKLDQQSLSRLILSLFCRTSPQLWNFIKNDCFSCFLTFLLYFFDWNDTYFTSYLSYIIAMEKPIVFFSCFSWFGRGFFGVLRNC